uniref:Uncharacterized protein n=1 Tax=Cannabis sativa TaxID=3483 RepID=A0A803PTJ3_CANSA
MWGIGNLSGFMNTKYQGKLLNIGFSLIVDRLTQPVVDPTHQEVAEVLGSLSVQDRDWRLLCTTAKQQEQKLIPEDAKLHREPVYKEPSEKLKEKIDKHLSKQTSQPTSEMTFLKQAQVLNRKPKTGTEMKSPIIPQKRKSEVVVTPATNFSKKLAELQAKLSQSKVKELTRGLETEKENGKKQYDQAVSDYIYTTLAKVPDFNFSVLGAKVAKMAEAFRAMSPTKTQGCGGNRFREEAETADTEEVADRAASKVADDSTAPTA